jgi:F0F1-type ATP synthase epsilon subunit
MINVKIFMPDKTLTFSAHRIALPSINGIIEILPMHENMIIALKNHYIIVDEEKIPNSQGIAIIENNQCNIVLYS